MTNYAKCHQTIMDVIITFIEARLGGDVVRQVGTYYQFTNMQSPIETCN